MTPKLQVGELLVAGGYLNNQQLDECLAAGKETGRRVGDIAVEKGFISQDDLMRVLENQHKVPYVDLYREGVNAEAMKLLPAEVARRNKVVPVKVEGRTLFVAMEDPKNFMALQDVKTAVRGYEVRPMLASAKSIANQLERMYGNESVQRALSDYDKGADFEEVKSRVVDISDADVGSAPIVQLVNVILEQAVTMGASDIHIEPSSKDVRVRLRIDGVLSVVMNAPLSALNAIITRCKIMGDLNIAERRVPQDGRFNIRVLGREIDIRLSIVATVYGEKAVMRLLDRATFFVAKEKLGFTPDNLKKFDEMLQTPHGILLVAGPTGSGKTTTLYSMLNEINDVSDNIITIEDPVEFQMEGLAQMQVNHKAGVSFATGLRAILRQDPDIIMLGEIRDAETVEIAVRAAITGHLLLSTIHTNDAVSTIMRLIDMGVPDYMVAASLVGVISQRLVRTICKECSAPYQPEQKSLTLADLKPADIKDVTFMKGTGCINCDYIGYKGRCAVHEILLIDSELRTMIHNKASVEDMHKYAVTQGMKSLKESAMDLVKVGRTTLDEMIGITHGV